MRRLSILIGFAFGCALLSVVSSYGEGGATNIVLAVTATAEYDDNITLATDPNREKESDLVLRIRPLIGFQLPHRDHSFSFDLNADYRKGTSTAIEDLNFTGTAAIELNSESGLNLSLADTYTRTSYDQELQEETGTPDYDRNSLRIGVSYIPVDRFQVAASYEQQRQNFEESDEISAADRDTDTLEASIAIPLTRSIVSEISYTSEELASPQRPDRNYSDETYTVGARWQLPNRFVVWLELGEQTIDFTAPGQSDFDDPTARIGTEIEATEFLSAQASIGRDGFGELLYDGSLSHHNDTDRQVSLSFAQDTQPSFSFVFESPIVQTRRFDLSVSDKLAQRFTLTLGAGYQTQESVGSEEVRDDEVWNGRLTVDYPVQEWFKLGFSYQYARRTSSRQSFDFTNNRVGVFATLTRR